MSLVKNSYMDLLTAAVGPGGGGGGGGSTELDQLADCSSNTTTRNLTIGIKKASLGGTDNCVVMNKAPLWSTLGSNNTILGNGYNQSAGLGSFNTCCGSGAGDKNSADSNTMVGYQALASNVSGSLNTCLGSEAGDGILSGSNNVCVGFSSGVGIIAGNSNICIGNSTEVQGDLSGAICIGHEVKAIEANALFLPAGLTDVGNNNLSKLLVMNTTSGKVGPTNLPNANGFLKNSAGTLSWDNITPQTAGFLILKTNATPVTWIKAGTKNYLWESAIDTYANGTMTLTPPETIIINQAGVYQIDITGEIQVTTAGFMDVSFYPSINSVDQNAIFGIKYQTTYAQNRYNYNNMYVVTITGPSSVIFKLNGSRMSNTGASASGQINNILIKMTRIN